MRKRSRDHQSTADCLNTWQARSRKGTRKYETYRTRIISRVFVVSLVMLASVSFCLLINRIIQDQKSRNIQQMHRSILDDDSMLASSETTALTDENVLLIESDENNPRHDPVSNSNTIGNASPKVLQPTILGKYAALYQQNRDFIGWIKVDSIYRINFSVVHGKNSFYEKHDFYGNTNVNGSAFLDETNKIWPRDDQLFIYAHNMKSGEMFGELNKMKSFALIKDNPFVYFDSLYEEGVYIPVAAYVCSVVQADDYFQFFVKNFRDADTFNAYLARAKELSLLKTDFDVQYGDQLLSLVTCCDRENKQRFVVLLRKLRADETQESVMANYFR